MPNQNSKMKKSPLRMRYEGEPEQPAYKGRMDNFPLTIDRIILVQTAFLGDVILSTALIRSLKMVLPRVKLDVVVIPQSQVILQGNEHINELYVFDKKNQHKGQAYRFLKKRLKQNAYDLAIVPHRSMTTARLIRSIGVKFTIGFDKRWYASLFYQIRVKRRRRVHDIQRQLDLLHPILNRLEVSQRQRESILQWQTQLPIKAEHKEQARSLCSNLGSGKLAVLAPGSVWPTKRWPQSKYAQLLTLLVEHGVYCLVIGSPEEASLAQEVIGSHTDYCVNACGHTSLLESAALIQMADILIGNDSAPIHIANAVGTTVVAIFGATSPLFGFYPFGPQDAILEENLPCQPCRLHGSQHCPRGHFKCMQNISSQQVWLQVARILGIVTDIGKDD